VDETEVRTAVRRGPRGDSRSASPPGYAWRTVFAPGLTPPA